MHVDCSQNIYMEGLSSAGRKVFVCLSLWCVIVEQCRFKNVLGSVYVDFLTRFHLKVSPVAARFADSWMKSRKNLLNMWF